jgi:hypothetical protein
MPYDMPHASQSTPRAIRSRPRIVRYPKSRAARAPANEGAPNFRPIEPMLLVYQDRVETIRLIAAALQRGFRAVAQSFAA